MICIVLYLDIKVALELVFYFIYSDCYSTMQMCIILYSYRLLWNQLVIALSLVINILMLITWDAPLALENVPANATVLPAALSE